MKSLPDQSTVYRTKTNDQEKNHNHENIEKPYLLLNLAAILSGPAVLVSVDLQKKYALNSMVPKPPSVEFFLFISEKTQYYFLHKVYITVHLWLFTMK